MFFHVSDPPTPEEEEAIATATGPIVIVPLPCKTVEEWIAKKVRPERSHAMTMRNVESRLIKLEVRRDRCRMKFF
jgi:hypothetical protein